MKEIVDHVIKQIEDAEVHSYPYAYLYIKNFFPLGYYQELCKAFPSKGKVWKSLSNMYKSRLVYDLNRGPHHSGKKNSFRDLSSKQQSIWREFQKYFIDDLSVAHVILDRYKEYLHCDCLDKAFLDARLSRDKRGYSIGAHNDRGDKIFSLIIYMINNQTLEDNPHLAQEWGTAILRVKDDIKKINPKLSHSGTIDGHFSLEKNGNGQKLFALESFAECQPNSAFSWCVTANSFHGVYPTTSDKNRDTIGYFLKIPEDLSLTRKLHGTFRPNKKPT